MSSDSYEVEYWQCRKSSGNKRFSPGAVAETNTNVNDFLLSRFKKHVYGFLGVPSTCLESRQAVWHQ